MDDQRTDPGSAPGPEFTPTFPVFAGVEPAPPPRLDTSALGAPPAPPATVAADPATAPTAPTGSTEPSPRPRRPRALGTVRAVALLSATLASTGTAAVLVGTQLGQPAASTSNHAQAVNTGSARSTDA